MSMKHVILAGLVTLTASAVALAGPAGGTVSGKVTYEGTPAKMKPIDMSKEPVCAADHKANPVTTENVVVGADGGLKNVVVYLSEGWSGTETAVSSAPTWDQHGCQYIPHVMGVASTWKPSSVDSRNATSPLPLAVTPACPCPALTPSLEMFIGAPMVVPSSESVRPLTS